MFKKTGWILDEAVADNFLDQMVIASVYPQDQGHQSIEQVPFHSSNSNSGSECEDSEQTYQSKRYKSALIRRFEFSSSLQRMSVICKNDFDKGYKAFVKGSPEKIAELCKAGSLPEDIDAILANYTMQGYRVIALAVKNLQSMSYRQIQSVKRNEIECNLDFLGLLIMQNKLKPVTTSTIEKLNSCNVRTVMATGDNILTAISVAKQCGIFDNSAKIYLGDLV